MSTASIEPEDDNTLTKGFDPSASLSGRAFIEKEEGQLELDGFERSPRYNSTFVLIMFDDENVKEYRQAY